MFESFETQVNLALSIFTLIGIGITGVIYIYKRGRTAGVNYSDGEAIKKEVAKVKECIQEESKKADEVHDKIFDSVHKLDVKINQIKGSVETMRDFLIKKKQ